MGYFDRLVDDRSFNTDANGKHIVYIWTTTNIGYIVPSEQEYLKIRSVLKRGLIFTHLSLFIFIFLHLYQSYTGQLENFHIITGVALLIMSIWTFFETSTLRHITKNYLVTLEKQVVVVSNKPSLWSLKQSLFISVLFLIGGIVEMWWLSENQDLPRFTFMLVIIVSGFFCIKNIRSIMLMKANTLKKTT